MSQLQQLQDRKQQLVLQRSQGKDIVEQTERELGQIQAATQVLQQHIKEEEEAAKAADEAGDPNIPATDPCK